MGLLFAPLYKIPIRSWPYSVTDCAMGCVFRVRLYDEDPLTKDMQLNNHIIFLRSAYVTNRRDLEIRSFGKCAADANLNPEQHSWWIFPSHVANGKLTMATATRNVLRQAETFAPGLIHVHVTGNIIILTQKQKVFIPKNSREQKVVGINHI